jgi:hypothetical protein
MASPFLANLALGYVKQKQTQQQAALDRQYAEESERRKMELDVEHQKRLQGLAFEDMMQKTVVQKGMNQQNNARVAEQYNQIAQTSKDPLVRKQAQKWASVYAGAGDLPGETVETLGKNLSPEKAGEVSVQELEFQRKQRNESLFKDKLNELMQIDFTALEKDPKLRQRTFLQLTKGLDTDYMDEARTHFEAFFPKPIAEKMPQHLQNAAIQHNQNYKNYMNTLNLVTQGKAEVADLLMLETQINQAADSLNEWLRESGKSEQYISIIDDDADPSTPGKPITPEKKQLLEQVGQVPSPEGTTRTVSPGTQGTRVDLPTRIQQIKEQNPTLTPAAIAKQLIQEGYSP